MPHSSPPLPPETQGCDSQVCETQPNLQIQHTCLEEVCPGSHLFSSRVMKSQSTLGHITRPADTLAMPSPVPQKLVLKSPRLGAQDETSFFCRVPPGVSGMSVAKKATLCCWRPPFCCLLLKGHPLNESAALSIFTYVYIYIYIDLSICICLSVKLLPSCLVAYQSIDLSMNLYVYLFINLPDLST